MAAGDLITQDWQIEYRSTLLGFGSPFRWRNLAGWLELPGMRLSDQARPFRHGAYQGALLADERIITYDFLIDPGQDRTGASYTAAVNLLRTITATEEAPDEDPLVIQLSGQKWLANVRVDRRALPIDIAYNAQASRGAIEWIATDPRLYSVALQSATIDLPFPGTGGLVFPLVFPLKFGTGTSGGNLALQNTGTITTWPTWTITGPVTGPIITNVGTGEVLQFDPTFTIASGQTLIINTDAKTVTLAGINRRSRLFVANWFGLKSGVTTQVRFTSTGAYDPAAQLTAQWRHATI